MAIYKLRKVRAFARRHGISDRMLAAAAGDVRDGRFDADLGGGLYKQRLARDGGGKSGGFRTLITHRTSKHLFFVYAYPKNARSNIGPDEEKGFKKLARMYGALSQEELDYAVRTGKLEEVPDGSS
jgi:hypothetical protein